MQKFWHHFFWIGLASFFGMALASSVPLLLNQPKLNFEPNFESLASSVSYQAAGIGLLASASTSPQQFNSVVDPIFTPPAAGKVIRADLVAMRLTLYENGQEQATFPILAKGRAGTPWETPAGRYRVLTKEENHFSSFGHVWMPWSLQFFGNFFIHGWPYNNNGKPVPAGYSGGCIRLSTEDAEKVYNFATFDTAVSVYSSTGETASSTEAYYLISQDRPKISAQAYAVADLETGQVVMSKNENQVEPIASVSKLLTALTSLETINQYRDIVVEDAALQAYGFQGGLRAGESLPAGELIYPLLLESSNDAAEVLARFYGRNQFIEQINNKAKAIGLTATKFEDPSGLSSKNVSTARDLAKLAHYLYQSKRFVFDVTTKRERSFGNHEWFNNNKLVGTEGYLGGKNGFTDEARQTQVALFELPLSEFAKRKVAIVILKSSDRENDLTKLVDYLKKNVVFGEKPANPTFKYL